MKIGIPIFGYHNFSVFKPHFQKNAFLTCNLGDNMQSIATRLLLQRLGFEQSQLISVNRDELASYSGPPVALIMNGVFLDWSFPIPDRIKPIFIGFNASEAIIVKFLDYFVRHQPIGCRDSATAQIFQSHNIEAFVSGCITMTLPRRKSEPVHGRVLVVYGGDYASGAGDFPTSALKTIPHGYFDTMEFIYQRIPVSNYPLDAGQCLKIESYAGSLLKHYEENAKIVITSLHHAATPCMALGIPVVICRKSFDSRFSFLSEITPIYTPPDFSEINWEPGPVDIEPIRANIANMVLQFLNQYR